MNFNNIGKSTPYFNIYKSLDGISRSAKLNKFVLLSTYSYILLCPIYSRSAKPNKFVLRSTYSYICITVIQ
jgi:hypothetical protein